MPTVRACSKPVAMASLAALVTVLLTTAPIAHSSGVRARNSAKEQQDMTRKKAGSGVTISHKIEGTPAAGQPFVVTLDFTGVNDPQGATVNVSAENGLLISGQTSTTLTPGAAGRMTVNASASGDGVYFLNVFTKQGAASGATSIPIKVGAGQMPLEKSGQVKSSARGERVISLPAK